MKDTPKLDKRRKYDAAFRAEALRLAEQKVKRFEHRHAGALNHGRVRRHHDLAELLAGLLPVGRQQLHLLGQLLNLRPRHAACRRVAARSAATSTVARGRGAVRPAP